MADYKDVVIGLLEIMKEHGGGTLQIHYTPNNVWLARYDVKETLTKFSEGRTFESALENFQEGLDDKS